MPQRSHTPDSSERTHGKAPGTKRRRLGLETRVLLYSLSLSADA